MTKKEDVILLQASRRSELGTNAVKRLRKSGWLPAVVYDSEGKSRPIKLKQHAFEMLVRRSGQNLIMDMQLDNGDALKVLLKDVQRDNIRDHMLHVDLQEISMTTTLRLSVSLRLVGEPRGVLEQSGVLEQLLREVEIECLPTEIVQELTMDVTKLKVDESFFVRDLEVPEGLTVLTPEHIAVASVLKAVEEAEKAADEELDTDESAEQPAEGDESAEDTKEE